MYHVTKIDDEIAVTPQTFEGHSNGYRQQILVTSATGSAHMTLSIGHLDDGGSVEPVLHSHEMSLYVFDGTLAVTTLGKTTYLEPDHCIVLPVGEVYALRSVIGPVIGGALISMQLPSNILFIIIGLPLIASGVAVLWMRGTALQEHKDAQTDAKNAQSSAQTKAA